MSAVPCGVEVIQFNRETILGKHVVDDFAKRVHSAGLGAMAANTNSSRRVASSRSRLRSTVGDQGRSYDSRRAAAESRIT